MKRAFQRHERVAGQLRRELASLIWSELKDPRLGPVTVTDVEVSRDLSHAKVFVESSDPQSVKDSLRALASSAGYLRRRLGQEMRMRSIPELSFRYDDSVERGNRIEELLASARRNPADDAPAADDETGEDGPVDDATGDDGKSGEG